MPKYCYLFISVIIASICFNCAGLKPKPPLESKIPTIRVLLSKQTEIQLKLLGQYELFEKNSFRIKLPENEIITIKISTNFTAINIFSKQNKIFSGTNVFFRLKKPGIKFQIKDKIYQGNVHFLLKNKLIQVINIIDLESYVKGVVPSEIGKLKKDEIEALKSQAIASRTYAMKKLEQKGKRKLTFDVSSGIGDQVYSGSLNRTKWSDLAVDDTFGEVAFYKNSLIHAFYHSTCGGRTEFGKNVFSGGNVPYLQGVADNFGQNDFCENSPHHRWVESFSFDEIEQTLKNNISGNQNIPKNSISDILVKSRFKSGRIKELNLIFSSTRKIITLKGDQLRRTIRKKDGNILRSNLFRIAKYGPKGSPTGFMLIGAGNGHGVGMCQWGAIGMARQGFDYHQILKHYYRGINIKKLY
jgi:stage II sporulation protein D